MAGSFETLFGGGREWGRRIGTKENAALIFRSDPLRQSAQLIARHELRVWFEPDWYAARTLAHRFPHCLICSIPVESNTGFQYRVPKWRTAQHSNGIL